MSSWSWLVSCTIGEFHEMSGFVCLAHCQVTTSAAPPSARHPGAPAKDLMFSEAPHLCCCGCQQSPNHFCLPSCVWIAFTTSSALGIPPCPLEPQNTLDDQCLLLLLVNSLAIPESTASPCPLAGPSRPPAFTCPPGQGPLGLLHEPGPWTWSCLSCQPQANHFYRFLSLSIAGWTSFYFPLP